MIRPRTMIVAPQGERTPPPDSRAAGAGAGRSSQTATSRNTSLWKTTRLSAASQQQDQLDLERRIGGVLLRLGDEQQGSADGHQRKADPGDGVTWAVTRLTRWRRNSTPSRRRSTRAMVPAITAMDSTCDRLDRSRRSSRIPAGGWRTPSRSGHEATGRARAYSAPVSPGPPSPALPP